MRARSPKRVDQRSQGENADADARVTRELDDGTNGNGPAGQDEHAGSNRMPRNPKLLLRQALPLSSRSKD